MYKYEFLLSICLGGNSKVWARDGLHIDFLRHSSRVSFITCTSLPSQNKRLPFGEKGDCGVGTPGLSCVYMFPFSPYIHPSQILPVFCSDVASEKPPKPMYGAGSLFDRAGYPPTVLQMYIILTTLS